MMSTLRFATCALLAACGAAAPPAVTSATQPPATAAAPAAPSTAAAPAPLSTATAPAAPSVPPSSVPPTSATPSSTVGPEWGALRSLTGSWEGRDPARQTTGRFTLAPDLGGKILVRHNVDDTPQGRHEDLMIVFHSHGGLRAAYYDNEGHVISYTLTADTDRIELISDEVPGAPRFHLTYQIHGADELAIDFAIAMPGTTEFKHYTGGTVHRVR